MNLSRDVERYLASGGRITEVPGFSPKPRGPHRNPPKKQAQPRRPQRAKIPEWKGRDSVVRMMREKGLTMVEVAKESGVPVKRLAMHLDGTFNPKAEDAQRIEDAVIKLCAPPPKAVKRGRR